MITRIDPPLPLETDKGKGWAHFLIDYGPEISLLWVVAIDETRQFWCCQNETVRIQKNWTFGRSERDGWNER